MEKIKTVFCSSDLSNVNHELVAYMNTNNEIYITIYQPDCNHDYESQFISLDLLTAIKLVKHLKKEIAIIKELEALNG
jgi:hypothetical protein